MVALPKLRPPTSVEQAVFKVRGRWPESYVNARLSHLDECRALISAMQPAEALAAIIEMDKEWEA